MTFTGIQFWPMDPREEEIDERDIAHALSLMCRANGHVPHFYSVGQHSILCAKEAKERGYSKRIQLACLLHDGSEAYLSDVTRPVKRHLSEYLTIEDRLQGAVYKAFGLNGLSDAEAEAIKEVDDALLCHELQSLMGVGHRIAKIPAKEWDLSFQPMDQVEKEFLTLLDNLRLL
jgi:hypothetical protein